MKNKLFLYILIAILSIFTLSLVGCGDDIKPDIIGDVYGGDGYDAVFCILSDTEVADTDDDVLRLIKIDGQTFDTTEGLEFSVSSDNKCITPTGTKGILKSEKVDEDSVTYLTATSGGKNFVIKVVVFAEYDSSEYAATYSTTKNAIIPYGVKKLSNEFAVSGISSIRIPSTVTEIEAKAFSKCKNLKAIKMSKNVESIGNAAFQSCTSLETISLPSKLKTIGNSAFRKCRALTSIVIPSGVESIGNYAFSGCSVLSEIEMPSALSEIGEYAFQNCSALKSIVIPEGVTAIGEWAFYSCDALEEITFPSTLTTIGSKAFMECKKLKVLTIPDSVTSICDSAFRGCRSIETVTMPIGLLPEADSFTGVSRIASVTLTGTGAGVDYSNTNYSRTPWYNSRTNKMSVKVSEGVTSIGEYTFVKLVGLTSVELPSTLKRIEHGAFRKCNNLTSVTIPEGVTFIGLHAFSLCRNLEEVSFPSTLKEFDNWAFAYCDKIKSVTIGNNVEKIGESAFYGCNGLTSVQLGTDKDSKLSCISKNAFYGLMFNCKSVNITSEKLVTIGEAAFGIDKVILGFPSYGRLADGSVITVANKKTSKYFQENYNYNSSFTKIKTAEKEED